MYVHNPHTQTWSAVIKCRKSFSQRVDAKKKASGARRQMCAHDVRRMLFRWRSTGDRLSQDLPKSATRVSCVQLGGPAAHPVIMMLKMDQGWSPHLEGCYIHRHTRNGGVPSSRMHQPPFQSACRRLRRRLLGTVQKRGPAARRPVHVYHGVDVSSSTAVQPPVRSFYYSPERAETTSLPKGLERTQHATRSP